MLDWDRSHDWLVERYFRHCTRITIHFQGDRPTAAELHSLRQCLPQFRHTPPAQLLSSLGKTLPLSEMPNMDARRVVSELQARQLKVVTEYATYIDYVPHDQTTGEAWEIQDDAEARATAEAMIAAGVPVQDIMVD